MWICVMQKEAIVMWFVLLGNNHRTGTKPILIVPTYSFFTELADFLNIFNFLIAKKTVLRLPVVALLLQLHQQLPLLQLLLVVLLLELLLNWLDLLGRTPCSVTTPPLMIKIRKYCSRQSGHSVSQLLPTRDNTSCPEEFAINYIHFVFPTLF